MPELTSILVASRERQHNERVFLAALQGVDLENNSSSSRNEWEDMKARVFSGGQTADSNDVISLQGANAKRAGFGIGSGLEYSDLKGEEPKNPFG